MYSEKIILSNLEEFAAREAWYPVYHTQDEVREFTAYVDKLIETESNSKSTYITNIKNITERRKQEVRRWVENERVICGLDSGYWESRYAYVVDEAGNEKKFVNRRSQDVFDSVIGYLEEQQAGIQ